MQSIAIVVSAKRAVTNNNDVVVTPRGGEKVQPQEAFWSDEMGEFFLKYEDVIKSEIPEKTLMDFLQSTYEAAARTSNWDRKALEK